MNPLNSRISNFACRIFIKFQKRHPVYEKRKGIPDGWKTSQKTVKKIQRREIKLKKRRTAGLKLIKYTDDYVKSSNNED